MGQLLVFIRGRVETEVVIHVWWGRATRINLSLILLFLEEVLAWYANIAIFTQLQIVIIIFGTIISISGNCALARISPSSISLQLKVDQSASDLEKRRRYITFHVKKINRSLNLDKRAKLRPIILNHYLSIFDFEEGMGATDADIRNFHICVHASADLKLVIPQVKHVHYFRWSTLDGF